MRYLLVKEKLTIVFKFLLVKKCLDMTNNFLILTCKGGCS